MTNPLRELLSQLASLDGVDELNETNLAELVGDVRDKIDAIKARLDYWESEAETIMKKYIKPLTASYASLLRNHDELNRYLKNEMLIHGYDKIPGNMFRVVLKKPVERVEYIATPEAYAGTTFVKKSTVYDWDLERIAAAKDMGEALPMIRCVTSRAMQFYTNVGDKK